MNRRLKRSESCSRRFPPANQEEPAPDEKEDARADAKSEQQDGREQEQWRMAQKDVAGQLDV